MVRTLSRIRNDIKSDVDGIDNSCLSERTVVFCQFSFLKASFSDTPLSLNASNVWGATFAVLASKGSN